MPKVTLYNTAGTAAGEIELNDSVFGVEYNEAVIHQAVVRQMANERLGNHGWAAAPSLDRHREAMRKT